MTVYDASQEDLQLGAPAVPGVAQDQSEAIQRRLDAADATGGVVLLGTSGPYRVRRPLRMRAQASLHGLGRTTSLVWDPLPEFAAQGPLEIGGEAVSDAPAWRMALRHLTVVTLTLQAGNPPQDEKGVGIRVTHAPHLAMSDVWVRGFEIGAIVTNRSHHQEWEQVDMGQCARIGLDIIGGDDAMYNPAGWMTDSWFRRCSFNGAPGTYRTPIGVRLSGANIGDQFFADLYTNWCVIGVLVAPEPPNPNGARRYRTDLHINTLISDWTERPVVIYDYDDFRLHDSWIATASPLAVAGTQLVRCSFSKVYDNRYGGSPDADRLVDAIQVVDSRECVLRNNEARGVGRGIVLVASRDCQVRGNRIAAFRPAGMSDAEPRGYGIGLMRDAAGRPSRGNIVTENAFACPPGRQLLHAIIAQDPQRRVQQNDAWGSILRPWAPASGDAWVDNAWTGG